MILLQIPDSTGGGGVGSEEKATLFQLLAKGGWVMYPIFILFALAIFLMVYKYFYLRKAAQVNDSLLQSVISFVKKGDRHSAMELCHTDQSEMARILERGLMRLGSPMSEIESGMESAVQASSARFNKHMGILSAIAKLAPMLGFLGTVIGMMTIFTEIADSGDIALSKMTHGMYIKMVSSAAGLTVGIIAHVGTTYLLNSMDNALAKLEDSANNFVDTLYKPQEA